MPAAIAVVQDLMFLSRIREAARASGAEVRSVRDPAALLQACRDLPGAIVLVDLDAERLRPLDYAAALRAEPDLAAIAVIGFVSHVHADLARAAQAAGFTKVMARGAFVQALPSLLSTEPRA
jgi:PleD family two-component response regulator